MQLKSLGRITFEYDDSGKTAGEKLDELAKDIRNENPNWSYSKCLEFASARHPELAREHQRATMSEQPLEDR